MTYTLWSRGRLVGVSDLGYARISRKLRVGDLALTPFGEKIMPFATGVSPALINLGRLSRSLPEESEGNPVTSQSQRAETLRHTTEYADMAAAEAHNEALELELRGPDGVAVRAEWIAIQDTHFLLSLPDPEECDDDWSSTSLGQFDPAREAALEAAIEHDRALMDEMHEGFEPEPCWGPPEESEFPRYQLMVQLLHARSVP